MRSYGDYAPWPVADTSDIPIQRDSIGAMSLTRPSDTFKPYVYRGTGEDTLTPRMGLAPKPRKKAKKRKPKPKPKPQVSYWDTSEGKQRIADMRKRRTEAKRRRALAAHDEREWRQKRKAEKSNERMMIAPARFRKHPVAAEGWEPMTGADLDDLFAALED